MPTDSWQRPVDRIRAAGFREASPARERLASADTSKIAKVDKQRMLTVRVPDSLGNIFATTPLTP
ncbi:MAG: hypothetical protein AAFP69_18445, partial [Planctomycetota bacterium]